jgi:4-hydroxybenzoyl-CoA thioesterase
MSDTVRAEFRRERLIRFSDCDPAGIVFYPQYFVMLNGLVEDWIDALGVGYRRLIIERRIGLPTVHVEADFKSVGHMGEHLALILAVERIGARSLTLQLRCAGRDDGITRMSLRQVLVTTSLVTHASVEIPADLRAAIAAFAATSP